MNRQKSFVMRLVVLVLLIVLIVPGMLYIKQGITQLSPVLSVTADPASNLNVSVKVVSTVCEDAGKIEYSLIELSVWGGKPIYDLIITNSENELLGPYPITDNYIPVRIKVYGGDHFTAFVRSSLGEIWSGTIGLSSGAEICKATPMPTATETITNIPSPTYTETVVVSPTSTPTIGFLFTPVDDTREPKPEETDIATHTSQGTSTSQPQSTSTPPPQSTITHPPQSTSTPPPQSTNTSLPQLTPTPINPHPKECEDGKDNDNDGKIDYPEDPECKKPSDPKEGK